MFTRIVKMEFKSEKVTDFITNFNNSKAEVRSQKGCHSLALYQDKNNPNVFFTYSTWESEADLDNYRHSDFFKGVWSFTKKLFNEKPMAWSVNEMVKL